MRQKQTRKRRTREHVIADLSVNYVERHVLLCGYTVEQPRHDYGYDLVLTTYDANGEVESGEIRIQVKATDFLRPRQDGQSFAFRLEMADLRLWLRERPPVILIVYDALREDAYWLYVQAYFQRQPNFDLTSVGQSVTVSVPVANKLNAAAVRRFASFRDAVDDQTAEVFHHDERL